MTWRWRERPDGFYEVDRGTGTYEVLELTGPDANTERTRRWIDLATKHGLEQGIPPSWILGVIYSESGGKPDIRNFCCGGLMALHFQVYGLTEAQAFDPEINVHLGAKTIGDYRKKGYELPTIASMYNAGPAKGGGAKKNSTSVWGMAENMPAVPWSGYIEKVVRAANWWRKTLGDTTVIPKPEPPLQAAGVGSVHPVIAWGFGAFAGWHLLRRLRKSSRK